MWRYIGEDIVLSLLGRNPYVMNDPNYHIVYNPQSPKIAKEIENFFTMHIPKDRIVEKEYAVYKCDDAIDREICRRIVVLNDFGNNSEVLIMFGGCDD